MPSPYIPLPQERDFTPLLKLVGNALSLYPSPTGEGLYSPSPVGEGAGG